MAVAWRRRSELKAVNAVKAENVVLHQGLVRFCPPGDENISGTGTSLVIPVSGHPRNISIVNFKIAVVVIIVMEFV